MTEREKILAEIERLKKELYKQRDVRLDGSPIPIFDTNAIDGMLKILAKLKGFINSLSTEQPSEDLEEAAMKEAHKRYRDCPPLNIGGDYEFAEYHGEERELFVEGAQWGANWQKEQLIDKAYE